MQHIGHQVPDQGSNSCSLHRKHRLLATRLPGKSQAFIFTISFLLLSVAKRHMERYSTSRYYRNANHLTSVRMAIIKKPANKKCWRGCGEKELLYCWWECKMVQPLRRTVWRLLKKRKIGLPYIWSSNPTPGHIPEENNNSKRHMHPKVHCNYV